MIISANEQFFISLYSLLLGACLCVFYDMIRLLRHLFFKGRAALIFFDLFFFFACDIALFSFYMQMTDGKFRIFVVAFAIIGFFAFRLTVGKAFSLVLKASLFLKKIIKNLLAVLLIKPLHRLLLMLYKLYKPILSDFRRFFAKNKQFFSKKLLQNNHKMLYNNSGIKGVKANLVRGNGKDGKQNPQKSFFC